MKKVLVISDNPPLVKHIQKIALENNCKFDYCYSAINKSPEDLIQLGMSLIDLKSPKTIEKIIADYKLIISAHCKQIFPEKLVDNVRCINIHPGLNPYNRGWYPQVFSIINKKPIGCTIHLIDKEIDNGDIIYQSEIFIKDSDTSLDIYQQVIKEEKRLLSIYLLDLINQNYTTTPPSITGNYNGISDFNNLCKLDLEHQGTFREHLDLLRALTHGDNKNAYFYDTNGEKVYIKLVIEHENC